MLTEPASGRPNPDNDRLLQLKTHPSASPESPERRGCGFFRPLHQTQFQRPISTILGGRISGLESIAETRADVLLEGMWANHAPVKITGQINPLIENPYVDLNLNISDIELSPFSPYSGKYIGYILEKGKLTFNVAYRMENRKLEATEQYLYQSAHLGGFGGESRCRQPAHQAGHRPVERPRGKHRSWTCR